MRIVLIGAGGHGKVCAEVAGLMGYQDILFLDDGKKQNGCGQYEIVGTSDEYLKFVDGSTNFFVSIGDAVIRQRMQEKISGAGGRIATLVHPAAVVGNKVEIGAGTVLMAGTVINAGTVVGQGTIINTASSVDHDCIVGNYCHVAVGAHLCGTVEVGNYTWIGAGAIVSNDMKICGECVIGAGAVVVNHIFQAGIYLGVPARKKNDGVIFVQ